MISIEQARGYYPADDPAHDFDHVLRVLATALRLAEAEGADPEIVRAAALLHDVGRAQERAGGGDHAAESARRAREILAGHPAARVEAVAEAIASHRFRTGIVAASLEARVLYDADKLDSIGAIGVARAYAVAGVCGQRLWAEVAPEYAERKRAQSRHDDMNAAAHAGARVRLQAEPGGGDPAHSGGAGHRRRAPRVHGRVLPPVGARGEGAGVGEHEGAELGCRVTSRNDVVRVGRVELGAGAISGLDGGMWYGTHPDTAPPRRRALPAATRRGRFAVASACSTRRRLGGTDGSMRALSRRRVGGSFADGQPRLTAGGVVACGRPVAAAPPTSPYGLGSSACRRPVSAAAMVASISAAPWAVDMKPASNCEGARYTPFSSMRPEEGGDSGRCRTGWRWASRSPAGPRRTW